MRTSLEPLEADLAIHQKLDDEPNDVGGLTAQELKEKFDEAGLVIQRYLNETHLPQVEAALGETLEAAQRYADGKVVEIGAGDMAAAVYDPQKRREDVYAYAEAAAREAVGGAARFGYVLAGTCRGSVTAGQTAAVTPGEAADPRGLWDAHQGKFVVPQGAEAMLFTVEVRWAKETFAQCRLEALVNGVVARSATGPEETGGRYVYETVCLPVKVKGGDRVELRLAAESSGSDQAAASARYLRAEILR